jgi:hypothetical protein
MRSRRNEKKSRKVVWKRRKKEIQGPNERNWVNTKHISFVFIFAMCPNLSTTNQSANDLVLIIFKKEKADFLVPFPLLFLPLSFPLLSLNSANSLFILIAAEIHSKEILLKIDRYVLIPFFYAKAPSSGLFTRGGYKRKIFRKGTKRKTYSTWI